MFYLFNPQTAQYEPVYTGDQGLCNYTLMPEEGYVVSSVSDGWRDGETQIYQWQDGALKLLRRATVRAARTVDLDDTGMVEQWDFNQYEMIVCDYTADEEGGQIIWRETYPEDDSQYEEHLALFDAKLWEGL